MQRICLAFAVTLLLAACSSKVAVQQNINAKGKKIGIGKFNIVPENKKNKPSTDTVCVCVGQSIGETLTPYLLQAGFTVVNLPLPAKANNFQMMMVADSMHVDYILSGNGSIDIHGSDQFIKELNVKAVNQAGEVAMSASLTGFATRPVKAANKIGKKLVEKIK